MKKALIIGASGLLGSRMLELGREKYELYGTFNEHGIEGESHFKLDVTDKTAVFDLIGKIKPDVIFDTHSITNVDLCETDKDLAWNVNVNGLRNVAEAAKTYGSKLVFLSTDYAFDGTKSEYGEKDKPEPKSYYGQTKIIGEKILEILDTNYIVARTSVIYGVGGQGKKTFVNWVLENLKNKKQTPVVIDQFNCPTFADDLAMILFDLYEKDASGLFHVVGSECISRYEFATRIADKFGMDRSLIKQVTTPELRISVPTLVAHRPYKLNLSTSKLERVIGRKPMGVDEGLAELEEQMR